MFRDLLNRYAAPLYMALAMLMWAVIENIPRYFTGHYTTYQIVWMRYSVHMLFMLAYFGPRVGLHFLRTTMPGKQIIRGMLMLGMHLSFIFAIRSISAHTTMTAFWIAPLLILAVSMWRKESPSRLYWLLTGACLVCILVMSRPLSNLLHPATLFGLVMALCFVIYMQMTRSMSSENLLTSLFYTAFSVWIVLTPLMFIYWVTPNLRDLLLLIVIGLTGYICILGFDRAAELAPTWVSAPFGYIQPILVLLTDWKLRGIYPGIMSLAAAGFILIALFVLLWMARKKQLPAGSFRYA